MSTDMGHKRTIFLLTMFSMLLLTALCLISAVFGKDYYVRLFDTQACTLNTGWTMFVGSDIEGKEVELPLAIEYGKTGEYTFVTRLSEFDSPYVTPAMLFISNHMDLKVYVEDDLIYKHENKQNGFSKTSGNIYHFVQMPNDYQNKELRIEIKGLLDDSIVYTVLPPVFGAKAVIIYDILKNDSALLSINLLIFSLGVILSLISTIFRGDKKVNISLFYTGIFAIIFGIYAMCETSSIHIMVRNSYLVYVLTFTSLALLPAPALMTLRGNVDEKFSKLIFLNVYLVFANLLVQIALNYLGIYDFREMLVVTHIVIAVSILVFLFSLIGTRSSSCPRRNGFLLSAVPMLVGAGMDVSSFYLSVIVIKNSFYFQLGVLLFLVIQLMFFARSYFVMCAKTVELDFYEKMAFTDIMTGLANRAAFEREIHSIDEHVSEYSSVYCISLDVNNLKEVNDSYGHVAGDSLIKGTAEIVDHVFGEHGTTFRIGGDEFVVFMTDITECDVYCLLEKMKEEIKAYNLSNSYHISLAMGLANYNEGTDKSVMELIKRADGLMYSNKKAIKEGTIQA